jgi:hypothetical protein
VSRNDRWLVALAAVAMLMAVALWLTGLALATGQLDLDRWTTGPTARPGSPAATATPTTAAPTTAAPTVGRRAPNRGPRATAVPRSTDGPRPTDGPTPTLQPAVDWPTLPDLAGRTPITTTAHFAVYAANPDDAFLGRLAAFWAPRLEPILAYVSARLGRELPKTPVRLVFAPAYGAPCPARGLAAPGEEAPMLMVYVDERTSAVQIRAVLAHEMVHHLTSDPRFVGDGILTEGIAHWGAGQMLLAWQRLAGWDDAVRDYLADGRYVSITDDTALNPRPGEDCIARRDRVYNIRAAFVDWLIRSYGLDTVLAMPFHEHRSTDPETGEVRVDRSPDYEAATGRSLADLERLWLEEVKAGGHGNA